MFFYFADKIEEHGFIGSLIVTLHELTGLDEPCSKNHFILFLKRHETFLCTKTFLKYRFFFQILFM